MNRFEFTKIRVLETGHNSGSWNMALDEVLMNGVGDTPILKIYGWKPSCVSIGYFQSMNEEVNVEKCKQVGIDCVRRITGGGAVFHESELTYSFISRNYPQSIMQSYEMVCEMLILTLKKLGFDAKFSPLNDIIVGGRKVCGNAQTRKNGVMLQHGTMLLGVDVEKMFSLLKVPKEKISDKAIEDVKQRVFGIGKKFDLVANTLKDSASETFSADQSLENITQEEAAATEVLDLEKYASKEWNFKR